MNEATRTRAIARRLRGKPRAAAFLTAATASALVLAVSGCGGGVVDVDAHPNVSVPQPGAVVSGSPSAAPTTDAAKCIASRRPTAAAANSGAVNAIRKRGKLIVGVAQDEYLTGYLDAKGDETGFDVEIARQVEQAIFGSQDLDKHIQFRAVTNAQRISALQTTDLTKAVDMVVDTFTINCDRAKQVLFSSVYYNAFQKLLVLKGTYNSLDQLGGKKVCAQNGSTSLQKLLTYPSHPIAYGVTNLTDCLVALQQGQVDAISTDDTILAGLAQQDPNTAVVGTQVEPEPYGVAVAPGNVDLIRFINGVLETIRGNGTWQRIYFGSLQPALGPQQPPAAQYAD